MDPQQTLDRALQRGRTSVRARLARLRTNSWHIAQCAAAAGVAWFLAADVLGHPTPFFAPVAAVVCLGTSYGQRLSRVVEVTFGVAIGVFIADLFVVLFGSGTWQMAVVVAVSMSAAFLLGAGRLFLTQAAVQSIIVTALVPEPGAAFTRWTDALIGGAVAVVAATVVPAAPLRRPREQAAIVMRKIVELLRGASEVMLDGDVDALRETFPSWEEVREAPVGELEEAIRPGGLAKQKAPRIQAILERLGEEPDLDWTRTAPREESLEFLLDLPGVGRKTAACVLIFTWGNPEIPVDVHVHRVGGRLGLFPAKASFERAHDEMLAIVPPEDAYELHMNLIRHGREICRPKPRCGECGLRRMCPWYRNERERQ